MGVYSLYDFLLSGKEDMSVIYESGSVRVERIVSYGYTSEKDFWYDQEETELVILRQGWATLEFESFELLLKSGDSVVILPHQRHRVKTTSLKPPCVWHCEFFVGVLQR